MVCALGNGLVSLSLFGPLSVMAQMFAFTRFSERAIIIHSAFSVSLLHGFRRQAEVVKYM